MYWIYHILKIHYVIWVVLRITLLYVDMSYFMNYLYWISQLKCTKKIILKKFSFIWPNYEKDNDGFFFKNVSKTSLLKCIEMQDLHAMSFKSNIYLIYLINFYVDFGKPSKM